MIFILADDLTGANDTGAQYTNEGYRTVMLADGDLEYLAQSGERYEVVSVNMNTRILPPDTACEQVRRYAQKLAGCEVEYIYKKVDSLMRGNPAQEIEAMMEALHIPVAVVSPGIADYCRVVRGGKLQTLSGRRAEDVVDIVALFKQHTQKRVVNLSAGLLRQGAGAIREALYGEKAPPGGETVVVVDAETDEDYDAICEGFAFLGGDVLFCGSAGLARALSRKKQSAGQAGRQNAQGAPRRILVVIGSRNAATARQVETLCDKRQVSKVVIPSEKLLGEDKPEVIAGVIGEVEGRLAGGQTLVVLVTAALLQPAGGVDHTLQEGTRDSLAIMDAFGEMVQKICGANRFDVVISSGGDTSMVILKSIRAKGIKVISEIMPGIPCGRILGGDLDNTLMITKSGGFGHTDSLVRVVEYVENSTM